MEQNINEFKDGVAEKVEEIMATDYAELARNKWEETIAKPEPKTFKNN